MRYRNISLLFCKHIINNSLYRKKIGNPLNKLYNRNMKLNVENATIEINGEALIDNINLEINDHDHIAIIGKNGAGKTTLLRALIDNSLFTASESDRPLLINKIGHFKIGYLEQIKLNDNITLYEELLSCYNDLLLLEKKINF